MCRNTKCQLCLLSQSFLLLFRRVYRKKNSSNIHLHRMICENSSFYCQEECLRMRNIHCKEGCQKRREFDIENCKMINSATEKQKCIEDNEAEYMLCVYEDCSIDKSDCQRRCSREMEVCQFSLHRLPFICLFLLSELYLFGRVVIK